MGQGRALPTCAHCEITVPQLCHAPLLSDILPSLGHGTARFQAHVAIVSGTGQDLSDPSAAAARAEVSEPQRVLFQLGWFQHPLFKRPIHPLSGGNYLQFCAERGGSGKNSQSHHHRNPQSLSIYSFEQRKE